jgi:signal transduction histidine kinase
MNGPEASAKAHGNGGRGTARASVRLARLYLVLSRVNSAIEQAHDRVDLLGSACQTVVEVGSFRMGWAALVDWQTGEVRPVASAGHVDGYLDQVRVRTEGERSLGPTGQAIRENRTIVCEDIAADPRMIPWRSEALRRGYRSSIGLPLRAGDAVTGALTVYSDRPRGFQAGEVELLEELARDVSFGLDTLENTVERRRAEAALTESEGRFRTSVETLLDPFVIMRAIRGADGRVVDFVYDYANEAACAANRLAREDLVGHRLLEILPEHGPSGLLDAYARVVDTGQPLLLDDLDYTDEWGGEPMARVFDVRANRIGDGLAYTWRDITERRHVERRRAEELEQRVRERTSELEAAREHAYALADFSTSALEAASVGRVGDLALAAVATMSDAVAGTFVIRDPETDVFRAVSAFGAGGGVLLSVGDPAEGRTGIREAINAGEPFVVADGAIVGNGGIGPRVGPCDPRDAAGLAIGIDAGAAAASGCSLLVVPLRAGALPAGALGVRFGRSQGPTGDQTAFAVAVANAAAHALERLRLSEAEREARGMLDVVVAQMPAGVTVVGRDGRMLYRNAAYLQAVRGNGPRETQAEGHENVPDVEAAGMHGDGRPYATDEWPAARSLAGGETIVNEEIRLRGADGSPVVVLQTSAPVRDRDGQIRAAVVVTLDVTERRAAEQLRSAFIGVLSHELRTPVTTIYAGARVLQSRGDRLDRATREEILADVAAECERLSRLVEDLLVLARAERGMDIAVHGAALVQHRLRSLTAAMAADWPDRRFVCDIPEHVPLVTGDEGYIEQVLRNLLGNAAKYGRHEVVARIAVRSDGVEVSVLDDGPGIDPADLEGIFDLFFRASTARHLPGAGIGLFVARRLVEAMGGRLWATNRPEGGAAFTFVLPLFAELDEAETEVTAADDVPVEDSGPAGMAVAGEAAPGSRGDRG